MLSNLACPPSPYGPSQSSRPSWIYISVFKGPLRYQYFLSSFSSTWAFFPWFSSFPAKSLLSRGSKNKDRISPSHCNHAHWATNIYSVCRLPLEIWCGTTAATWPFHPWFWQILSTTHRYLYLVAFSLITLADSFYNSQVPVPSGLFTHNSCRFFLQLTGTCT
jgi:hypothetical protein